MTDRDMTDEERTHFEEEVVHDARNASDPAVPASEAETVQNESDARVPIPPNPD